MRHAAKHQSRPLKDDRNILQLISAGIQVAKILKDSSAMGTLDHLYVTTERQIQERSLTRGYCSWYFFSGLICCFFVEHWCSNSYVTRWYDCPFHYVGEPSHGVRSCHRSHRSLWTWFMMYHDDEPYSWVRSTGKRGRSATKKPGIGVVMGRKAALC